MTILPQTYQPQTADPATFVGQARKKLSAKKQWKSELLRKFFFVMDGAQWLVNNTISLEAIVELTGDSEFTSSSLTAARANYQYLARKQ